MDTLHFELVKATEAAAISASAEVGRGDKIAADLAATVAMRDRLNKLDFAGRVIIGEGIKDDAPGLFKGELVGSRWTDVAGSSMEVIDEVNQYDIALDPLDGTSQVVKGGTEAMSVIAVGDKGSLLSSDAFYMQKLAVGPQVCSKVELNITDSLSRTIKLVSLALSKEPSKLTVCMLDRPRHTDTVEYLRKLGCRIKLIQDCDVSAAIATAMPDSGIDIYLGVGGTPEGVLAAVAMKCLHGFFQGRLCDKDEPVWRGAAGGKVYDMDELAKGDVIFCATGVVPGSLLKGVTYSAFGRTRTHSLLMRSSSGTVRFVEAFHGN